MKATQHDKQLAALIADVNKALPAGLKARHRTSPNRDVEDDMITLSRDDKETSLHIQVCYGENFGFCCVCEELSGPRFWFGPARRINQRKALITDLLSRI